MIEVQWYEAPLVGLAAFMALFIASIYYTIFVRPAVERLRSRFKGGTNG